MSTTVTVQHRSRARRRRGGAGRFLIATVALLGLAVLLYPSVASWASSLVEQQAVDGYLQHAAELDPAASAAELAEAEQYNASLDLGLVIEPFSSSAVEDQPVPEGSIEQYLAQLASDPSGVMAQLTYPDAGIDLPIFHGTTDDVLGKGVGHLFGSALPVGGDGTHAVLTGHSGLPQSKLFDGLHDAEVGQLFRVTALGQTAWYEVVAIETIDPADLDGLQPQAGRDLVSLVTCTPIGINSHRLVVTAERTQAPGTADGDDTPLVTAVAAVAEFPWAVVALGAATVAWLWLGLSAALGRGRSSSSSASTRGTLLDDAA